MTKDKTPRFKIVRASEIPMGTFSEWQYMSCPDCEERTQPHGGFGPDPHWKETGKYWCRSCKVNWYGRPKTGDLVVRHGRDLRVTTKNEAVRR